MSPVVSADGELVTPRRDLYREAAARRFNLRPEDVTREQRQWVKQDLYRTAYGWVRPVIVGEVEETKGTD